MQQLKNLPHWITMVAKTETMPIQENNSIEKKSSQLPQILKPIQCDIWLIRTAGQIAEWITLKSPKAKTINKSPANPHESSFMDVKDPIFCLQINGKAVWESRQVWTERREKLKRKGFLFLATTRSAWKDAQNVCFFLTSTSIDQEIYGHFEALVKIFRWVITFLHFIDKWQV